MAGILPKFPESAPLAELLKEAPKYSLPERLLAEGTGTFFLVLTVCWAVASGSPFAAVAIGTILSIQIYTFGSVSGGCLNPAVTLAVLLSGRGLITPPHAAAYMAAETVGGILAGIIAYLATDTSFYFDWDLNPNGGVGSSLILEVVYTAALCLTVLHAGTSYDTPNNYFGFAIGGTVLASAYACSTYDQGSFNPAVTIGANIANYMNGSNSGTPGGLQWIVYLLAPMLGSLVAVGIFRGTRQREYKNPMDPKSLEARPKEEGLAEPVLLREKLLAEATGTFYLVFTVSMCVAGGAGGFAGCAIGLMLGIQIYCYGSVSGGMLNPAVALAVFLSGRGKLSGKNALAYVGAQCGGAIVAGLLGWLTADSTFYFDWELNENGGAGTSLIAEALFTMALCGAVLSASTSDAPNDYYGFAIGGVVVAGANACSTFDQGSFNPAVTLGIDFAHLVTGGGSRRLAADCPKSVQDGLGAEQVLLFVMAPLLGGAMAAGVFAGTRKQEVKEGAKFWDLLFKFWGKAQAASPAFPVVRESE